MPAIRLLSRRRLFFRGPVIEADDCRRDASGRVSSIASLSRGRLTHDDDDDCGCRGRLSPHLGPPAVTSLVTRFSMLDKSRNFPALSYAPRRRRAENTGQPAFRRCRRRADASSADSAGRKLYRHSPWVARGRGGQPSTRRGRRFAQTSMHNSDASMQPVFITGDDHAQDTCATIISGEADVADDREAA